MKLPIRTTSPCLLAACCFLIANSMAGGSEIVEPRTTDDPQRLVLTLLQQPPDRVEQPEPQRRPPGRRGEWNLVLSGMIADELFSDTGYGVELQLGHLIGNSFEVYLSQSIVHLPAGIDSGWFSGSSAQSFGMTRIGFNQYLSRGRMRPYLGLNGGLAYGDGSGGTAHARLGLRGYSTRRSLFWDAHAEGGYFSNTFLVAIKAGLGIRW